LQVYKKARHRFKQRLYIGNQDFLLTVMLHVIRVEDFLPLRISLDIAIRIAPYGIYRASKAVGAEDKLPDGNYSVPLFEKEGLGEIF